MEPVPPWNAAWDGSYVRMALEYCQQALLGAHHPLAALHAAQCDAFAAAYALRADPRALWKLTRCCRCLLPQAARELAALACRLYCACRCAARAAPIAAERCSRRLLFPRLPLPHEHGAVPTESVYTWAADAVYADVHATLWQLYKGAHHEVRALHWRQLHNGVCGDGAGRLRVLVVRAKSRPALRRATIGRARRGRFEKATRARDATAPRESGARAADAQVGICRWLLAAA